MRRLPRNPQIIALFVVPVLLALLVACGGAAQTEEPTTGQSAAEQAVPTAIPIATAIAAVPADPSTTAVEQPTGTLTVGQKELGPFMGHPELAGNPQIFLIGTAPVGEPMLTVNSDLEPVGMLAKSWEVSEDALTWTFHMNEGVPFHKGYGEMTAEDVISSFNQFASSAKHPRASKSLFTIFLGLAP